MQVGQYESTRGRMVHALGHSVVVPHGTRIGAFDLLHAHAGDEESLVEAQPSSPQPLWIREQGVEETTLVGQMGVYGEGRGHCD